MKESTPARRAAHMGLLFALALALSLLEGRLAPLLPLPLPGVRLGLSNVAVMYCLFLLSGWQALLLCCLKAIFALMTRGLSAALLSLCGGVCSIAAMALLLWLLGRGGRPRAASYTAVSVTGAVCHNMGQLCCAAVLLRGGAALWYYCVPLAAAGVLVGILNGALLRGLLPALKKALPR